MWTRDREPIGYCDICEEPIYEEDCYFEFPDDMRVCNDTDCLCECAEQYRLYGGRPLI